MQNTKAEHVPWAFDLGQGPLVRGTVVLKAPEGRYAVTPGLGFQRDQCTFPEEGASKRRTNLN